MKIPPGNKKAKANPRRTPINMAVPILDLVDPCEEFLINGPSLRPFMASRSAQTESFRGTQKGENDDYPQLKAQVIKHRNVREYEEKRTRSVL